MNPRVTSVVPEGNARLKLRFSNGEEGLYDCTPLLDLGVFRELRDPAYFRRVVAAGGTVVWPHEQDICPDTLYEDSRRQTNQANASVTGSDAVEHPDPRSA
jgi:hypothetical protein